jgi:hypothetical protein
VVLVESVVRLRDMRPSKADFKRSLAPMLRGTIVGSLCSLIPGTGPTIASFIAYATDKKVSKTPELFGTGMIEGVVCPEICLIFPSEITTFCEDKPAGLIYGFADPNADHITPRRSSLRRANSALTAILQLVQVVRFCGFATFCSAVLRKQLKFSA